MFFSRALLVVYKTTGGHMWNSSGSLKPLSACQQRNRRRNTEQTLKNMSVIKMAAAAEPPQPTRLYKPLNHWRLLWMRKRMEQSKTVLGWDGSNSISAMRARLAALSERLQLSAPQQGALSGMAAASQAKLP